MTTTPSGTQRITLDDFMTGLLAALASFGARAISIDSTRFHAAVHAAFCELESTCAGDGPRLAFWITRHPVYRDSADIREGIARAAVWGLVTFDSPRFATMRILFTEQESSVYLENLPAAPDIYRRIADVFLSVYTNATATEDVAVTGGSRVGR